MIENFFPKMLVKNIAENSVPQKFQILLYFSIFAFHVGAGRPPLFNSSTSDEMRFFILVQAMLSFATAWFAYQENGANDGKDFIQRFFLIGGVLYVWVNVISLTASYALFLAFNALLGADSAGYLLRPCGLIQYCLMISSYVVWIGLVVKYFRLIRQFCDGL
ncbi:MAG: hypothetical protein IPK50_19325 [Fibrobacterota bacterium]|nr:hypothetical protein [Fibrobacterota bacterium]QQS04417.1 MAG: hypothetical protein IPK50_19325 [Fibrobacterota bacterium]